MKMLWSKITGGVLLLFLAGAAAMGQSANCSQALADAQARFDMGNLSGIPESLEGCILTKGFTPEENVRAHKLMTLVYLYQDNQPKADEWMIKLLNTDKEHRLDTINDPKEIFFHYDKFRSKPIFRISMYGGGNLSTPSSLTGFGPDNTADEFPERYKATLGVSGGIEIEKEFYKGIGITGGLRAATRTFTMENYLTTYRDESLRGADEAESNTASVKENQLWVEVPAAVKYTYYNTSMWAPYAMVGASAGYLATSAFNGIRAPEGAATVDINFASVIDDGMRNQLHLFYFGGLGVKRRSKTNYLLLEVRYMKGMNNLATDKKMQSSDQNLIFRIGHADDNFTINSLLFNLGYQLSIYNPQKIKP